MAASAADSDGLAPGTNRLASLTGGSGPRSISYDARGNPLSETRPGGLSITAAYDGCARLTGYTRTGASALTHVYNGLDDRVATTRGAQTRRYVYNGQGRVIGEYGTSATDVKAEFIWLHPEAANDTLPFGGDDGTGGYAPLAVVTPDSASPGTTKLSWVHGNHLGVPVSYTDAAGTVIAAPHRLRRPRLPGAKPDPR